MTQSHALYTLVVGMTALFDNCTLEASVCRNSSRDCAHETLAYMPVQSLHPKLQTFASPFDSNKSMNCGDKRGVL